VDVIKYFESLSTELSSLKDRVRYIIDDKHWLTDGEWKESVLRSILRRHLPSSVCVGSGFLVTPEDKRISQIPSSISAQTLDIERSPVFLSLALNSQYRSRKRSATHRNLLPFALSAAHNLTFEFQIVPTRRAFKSVLVHRLFPFLGKGRDDEACHSSLFWGHQHHSPSHYIREQIIRPRHNSAKDLGGESTRRFGIVISGRRALAS